MAEMKSRIVTKGRDTETLLLKKRDQGTSNMADRRVIERRLARNCPYPVCSKKSIHFMENSSSQNSIIVKKRVDSRSQIIFCCFFF